MQKIIFCLLVFCFADASNIQAQHPPFYDEIQAFKKQDSIQIPPQHALLFIGSSSFRMWKDVQAYFPGYTIINRGFGGSSLPDVIRYAGDIIFPYHPKEIIIYCGENDFATSDTVTGGIVFNRFKNLLSLIRTKMKTVPVVFVSIKPSPSRRQYWPEMIKANEEIKNYLATQKNTTFVDVFTLMMNGSNVKPEIFKSDSLHMNAKGYAIWQKAILPYLVK